MKGKWKVKCYTDDTAQGNRFWPWEGSTARVTEISAEVMCSLVYTPSPNTTLLRPLTCSKCLLRKAGNQECQIKDVLSIKGCVMSMSLFSCLPKHSECQATPRTGLHEAVH